MIRFLLKTAFFFFCLLLILPFFSTFLTGEPVDQDGTQPQSAADVGGAVTAARGTLEYMSGLCGEKPEVCVNGIKIIDFLRHRAGEGADVAYRYLGQHFDKADDGADDKTSSPTALPAVPGQTETAATPLPAGAPQAAVPDAVITGAIVEPPPLPVQTPAAPETLTAAAARPDLTGIRLDVPLPTPRPY
ncbi:DUF5330 domain-containing protein [Martelella sp. HB161492]|uniref:DUF5330 domain-containing protein n=1 Tax=Martelella sp. HB161492 TaxID=2720726 RepID=UPI0015914D82|nr:DUF5330 domain-containing protein [Martelella sp. HB161492]